MGIIHGDNRYKVTSTQLSNYGTNAKLHDLTAEDIVTGKTKKLYRVELSRGTPATQSRVVRQVDKFGTADPANDKIVRVDYKSDAYEMVTELLNDLGIARNIKRRDAYVFIKLSYGYLMELSQNSFTYTENNNSEAQRVAYKNRNRNTGPLLLKNTSPIEEETRLLLKNTNVEMMRRLRSFEESNPSEATSWKRDNWQSVCIELIKKAMSTGRILDAMNYMMFAHHHGWDVSKVLAAPVAPKAIVVPENPADERTIPYEFATYKDYCDYRGLYGVLIDALDQAAYGKGMERHANDLPFEEQRMQSICDAQGSAKGMGYQVIKKILESDGMEYGAKKREILGAIVYAAGMIIWESKQPIEE